MYWEGYAHDAARSANIAAKLFKEFVNKTEQSTPKQNHAQTPQASELWTSNGQIESGKLTRETIAKPVELVR
jgi:hypothetical protein